VAYVPTRSRQYQLPHSFTSAFSTQAIHLEKAKSQTDPDAGSWKPLAMSFESIGIGKNMKMLVLLIASVTAILEVFICCESVWNWWKGEAGDTLE
jgi:hypothetical protein